MAFIWVKQSRALVQPAVHHKPILSNHWKPQTKEKEGFQTSPGSGSTCGSRSQPAGTRFANQIDLPVELQAIYGEWEITPQDSYYDDYEINEQNAILLEASKFKNIRQSQNPPFIFGSTLGAFDAGATTIPWDKDNEIYQQKDVVWGQVSKQASLSIFLKTYLNEVANNLPSLPQCSPDDKSNYCYNAPMLNITTRDESVAAGLQVSEAIIQAVGALPMMYAQIDMNLSNFREIVTSRYNMFANILGATPIDIDAVETNRTQVGAALELATGKVSNAAMRDQKATIEANLRNEITTMQRNVRDNMGKVQAAVGGMTVAAWLATIGTGGAAAAGAAAATSALIALDIFFGVLGAIAMAVEGIITPIYQAMYKTGGVCPDGYKEITEILSPGFLLFLQNFIPLGSFLVTFNPYVCWALDTATKAKVRLKMPPNMPAFMSDRSLSLIYHAPWQSGYSPEMPIASSVTIELDPLPPGYQWLTDSDLANSPDANAVTQFAKKAADLAKTTSSYTSGVSGTGRLAPFVAVKRCDPETIPSADGEKCLQKKIQTTQAIPSISPCDAGKYDDGYNCWEGELKPDCVNQFQYDTVSEWDDKTGYIRIKQTTCPATSATIHKGFQQRLTCSAGYELEGLICYKKCDTGYTRDGAYCKGRVNSYNREYMYGKNTMYVAQKFNVKTLKDLSDVKVPYCDFSSEVMLNKMAQFYYSNSLLHPQFNEDGTVQIQMITMFKGVIASSELSCDVACRIEFINYDPITGGKYTAKVGCSYGDEDPEFMGLTFCYRRFYFIRVGNEPQGEFTVTGCTFADYTAPDGKTLSYSETTNPLVSLGPADCNGKTKTFNVIQKENVSIIDWDRFHREIDSRKVERLALIGAFEAGVSIAASVYGARLGMAGVGRLAARNATRTAGQALEGATRVATGAATGAAATPAVGGAVSRAIAEEIATTTVAVGAREGAPTAWMAAAVAGGTRLSAEEALTVSSNVTTSIQRATKTAADDVAAGTLDAGAVDAAIRQAGREKAIAEGLSEEVSERLVSQLMRDMQPGYISMFAGVGGGIAGGVGAGLTFSMGLHRVLEQAAGGAILPSYVDSLAGTHVVGTSMDNLEVVTNQNWWKAKHGSIYELAEGFIPKISPCQITSKGDRVQVSSEYCKNKYMIRNMVNMYHNTYQNAHIREITGIEPRGTSGCYYKWNEVSYTPETNTEGTVLVAKEMIMTNAIKDEMTCTYFPTGLTDDVKNSAYYVRQYTDPGLTSSSSRTVYPTRSFMYTSDIYARYVRVRPAATNPKVLTLAQIGIFDVSGMNISTNMTVYTSTAGVDGGLDPKDIVNGSFTMGDTESSVWQSSNTDSYWQLDLGKTVNIAEVVYIGGTFAEAVGRNIGVRIEFLYTDGPTDAPITTHTLATDESTQIIKVYSSVFTTPMFPLGGPIKIPRPIQPDTMLALERGCKNKCQDRSVIDSLIGIYNNLNSTSAIVKVLRATTPTTSSCEYEAEVLTTDTTNGVTRNSLTKQILSMQVTPEVTGVSGCVLARYVKIIPSFVPGTVLEFSKILVRNVTRDATGTRGNVYVSRNATNIRYNMFYQLEEIAMSKPNPEAYLKFLTDDTTKTPADYPNIFRAASNNPLTFFILDLNPPATPNACNPAITGKNYDIYDIQFIGANDRIRGGIKGITIELYRDRPEETEAYKAFDGSSYEPVFRYILPTDDVNPPPIVVAPPAKCKFSTTLDGIKVLKKPAFLQKTTPPLSEPDTSGGVFGFSSILSTIGSAWNALMPISPERLSSEAKEKAKKSGEVVQTILDTVSATKTILDTTVNCKNPEVLKRMMLLYNIKKGGVETKTFGLEKDTMTRILKSGQSTPSTCDIMFENLNEFYKNYTVDADKEDTKKTVKTARFSFNSLGTMVVPDPESIVYDISANALGLMTNAAALSTVYSGTYSPLNCRDPVLTARIKAAIFRQPFTDSAKKTKVETQFKTILQSFQTTPLSCEYRMQKLEKYTSLATNISIVSKPIITFVKAIFSLDPDGYTPVFSSAKEYDPNDITVSSDNKTLLKNVETELPSIFFYDTSKGTTSRIIATTQNI